jgi:hypothetical protein
MFVPALPGDAPVGCTLQTVVIPRVENDGGNGGVQD